MDVNLPGVEKAGEMVWLCEGWRIRVCRMAVGPHYPTPWMAFATKSREPQFQVGFNTEATTYDEAVKLSSDRIKRDPGLYDRIAGAGRR